MNIVPTGGVWPSPQPTATSAGLEAGRESSDRDGDGRDFTRQQRDQTAAESDESDQTSAADPASSPPSGDTAPDEKRPPLTSLDVRV